MLQKTSFGTSVFTIRGRTKKKQEKKKKEKGKSENGHTAFFRKLLGCRSDAAI
jgi:hypothetical protein